MYCKQLAQVVMGVSVMGVLVMEAVAVGAPMVEEMEAVVILVP